MVFDSESIERISTAMRSFVAVLLAIFMTLYMTGLTQAKPELPQLAGAGIMCIVVTVMLLLSMVTDE